MNKSIKKFISILPYIVKIVYFNFHYLPYRQAIKLPIWLYKPSFGVLNGSLSIDCKWRGGVKPGMIRLGFNSVALYPNTGIHIQIAGGELHFLGTCNIGNNSFIAVGKHGKLNLGNNFRATSSIKIACQHEITFESNVLCGWETMFVDSDFHRLKNADGSERNTKPYGPIHVGDGCWFGFRSVVMKNNVIPRCCVVSSNSIVLKSNDIKEYSLLAGQPAQVIKSGVYRDYRDDVIEYN